MTQSSRTRPRLLVVGASPMRHAAFARWQAMGLDVVLADGYSTCRYEELATEYWPLDPRDESADLERLGELAATCDGVTTASDGSQLAAAAVAQRAGRPGVGVEAARIARSKARQRELCRRAGIPAPRWTVVRTAEDVTAFFAQDGPRPAVLKPVDCAGGAGAVRVEDADDALAHWRIVRSVSPSKSVVLEDFLTGREVCVDAIVHQGRVAFASTVDCQHMDGMGFLCTAATYSTAQIDTPDATAAIQHLADAIGLGGATVHAEYKIEDDVWSLVEVGLRPGGAFVPELTVRVSGVDIYEAQALLALGDSCPVRDQSGGAPDAPYGESRYLVGRGQVRRFVPPAGLLDGLPDVRVVNQQAHRGQHLRVPLSEASRAGYAYGWGDDPVRLDTQLREALRRLAEAMGVTVESDLAAVALAAGTAHYERGSVPCTSAS